VVTACSLADDPTTRDITGLSYATDLDAPAIDRWRTLILRSGALGRIEAMTDSRFTGALGDLAGIPISDPVRAALANPAAASRERSR